MKTIWRSIFTLLAFTIMVQWVAGMNASWASQKSKGLKFQIAQKSSKQQKQQAAQEDDDDEVDEDFVDRQNVDLSQFKSKEVLVDGAVCDACVYRIKSVLQESPEIFKVNHKGLRNYYIYFNKGKSLSDDKIKELIQTAGYKALEVK